MTEKTMAKETMAEKTITKETMAEETDVIDISNDELAAIISNPAEYRSMVIDILKTDPSKLALKVREKLENNDIDKELDMLLRRLAGVMPYNIMIPFLRDQLGLSIQSDNDCIKSLSNIKKYLNDDQDKGLIDQIIEYVISEEGELDEQIEPELNLMALVDQIPIEKFPELYNCIDYINEITE